MTYIEQDCILTLLLEFFVKHYTKLHMMYMSYQNKCCAVKIITKMKYKHKMLNIGLHVFVNGSKTNMYEKYEYDGILLGMRKVHSTNLIPCVKIKVNIVSIMN